MNIGIIGSGYVGNATRLLGCKDEANDLDDNLVLVYDIDESKRTPPDLKMSDLQMCDVVFVCVPTPARPDGTCDTRIVETVVSDLKDLDITSIVVRSTVPVGTCERLGVAFMPEFLTEKNALDDFINPPMHVFGGAPDTTKQVEKIYEKFSRCKPCPVFHMSIKEASFVKYGINSFLATKVLWFNQFKDLIDQNKSDYDNIIKAIGTDNRIGFSHTQVPGPDNKIGFGGACFPKDTQAFSSFAKNNFTILDKVIEENNKYRSQYELDDREKEQKVVYINP